MSEAGYKRFGINFVKSTDCKSQSVVKRLCDVVQPRENGAFLRSAARRTRAQTLRHRSLTSGNRHALKILRMITRS